MKFERNGYVIRLENGVYKIANRYGVMKTGYATTKDIDKIVDNFSKEHEVLSKHEAFLQNKDIIKRVAYDGEIERFVQIQADKRQGEWRIQEFDDCLILKKVIILDQCLSKAEAYEWIKDHYHIQNGLRAEVFKNPLGDFTNGGISSEAEKLYILDIVGPYEPEDIRECVITKKMIILCETYVKFLPVYRSVEWYVNGGNFLYTNDRRMKEITGIDYPVPIHDRVER